MVKVKLGCYNCSNFDTIDVCELHRGFALQCFNFIRKRAHNANNSKSIVNFAGQSCIVRYSIGLFCVKKFHGIMRFCGEYRSVFKRS